MPFTRKHRRGALWSALVAAAALVAALIAFVPHSSSASPAAAGSAAGPPAGGEDGALAAAGAAVRGGDVPPGAKGPVIDPAKGYVVKRLGDRLYWVSNGSYDTEFLTTGKGVVVVDAPPGLTRQVIKAVGEVTSEPIRWVIYSHSHGDHVGEAYLYPKDARFIAQQETADLLRRAKDPKRPVPGTTFTDRYVLHAGDQTLELSYPGNNHQPGNILIWAPKQKVLMAVDLVYPGWVPFAHMAIAKDVPGVFDAYDKILGYPFEHFIGGHVTRYGSVQDVRNSRAYIHDVRTNATAALKSVDFAAVAGRVGRDDPWKLFDAYLDEVAETCAAQTNDKWRGTLGGADAFTESNCWSMAESLRVDSNAAAS